MEQSTRLADGLLARRHAKRVAQMADHLVRGHPSPSGAAIWSDDSQPAKDFGLVAVTGPPSYDSRKPSLPAFCSLTQEDVRRRLL